MGVVDCNLYRVKLEWVMQLKEIRKLKCPACKGESIYSIENKSRPFCSERCRTLDTASWADEAYKIPTKLAEESDVWSSQLD